MRRLLFFIALVITNSVQAGGGLYCGSWHSYYRASKIALEKKAYTGERKDPTHYLARTENVTIKLVPVGDSISILWTVCHDFEATGTDPDHCWFREMGYFSDSYFPNFPDTKPILMKRYPFVTLGSFDGIELTHPFECLEVKEGAKMPSKESRVLCSYYSASYLQDAYFHFEEDVKQILGNATQTILPTNQDIPMQITTRAQPLPDLESKSQRIWEVCLWKN